MMSPTELRNAISLCDKSIAAVARLAGVPATTLYSFMSGDTQTLRADTHAKVQDVVGLKDASVVQERQTPLDRRDAVVEIPVSAELRHLADRYGLDVEALLAAGGVPRLREAFKAEYVRRHRSAITAINKYAREHATPSEQLGMI